MPISKIQIADPRGIAIRVPQPVAVTPSGGVVKPATKIVEAALSKVAQNPAFQAWEQLWRVQPDDSWYDPLRAPANPTQVEIGDYEVPAGRSVLVLDYIFQPYRFTGVGAIEAEPDLPGRMTGMLGYSFMINGSVPGTVSYELDPTPSFDRRKFRPDPSNLIPLAQRSVTDAQRAAANAYGIASGYGTGILPQRTARLGCSVVPFSVVCFERSHITMTAIIYRRMPRPLAFIEAEVSGYIASVSEMTKLINDLKDAQ